MCIRDSHFVPGLAEERGRPQHHIPFAAGGGVDIDQAARHLNDVRQIYNLHSTICNSTDPLFQARPRVGLLVAVPLAATIGVLARFAIKQYLASPVYTGRTD